MARTTRCSPEIQRVGGEVGNEGVASGYRESHLLRDSRAVEETALIMRDCHTSDGELFMKEFRDRKIS